MEDFESKNILIMGFGGSGLSCAFFFLKRKAIVTITDLKSEEELKDNILKLDRYKVNYKLGFHDINDFKNADLVIKSPGISRYNNNFLSSAKRIETDISIFLSIVKNKIIAVTGTKGKSTLTSLIHKIIDNSFIAGNIGVSPIEFIDEALKNEKRTVVLELSSFQLGDLNISENFKKNKTKEFEITFITNIFRDHQNYYSNMKDYIYDKEVILKRAKNAVIFFSKYTQELSEKRKDLKNTIIVSSDIINISNSMYIKGDKIIFNNEMFKISQYINHNMNKNNILFIFAFIYFYYSVINENILKEVFLN